jgi:hypothetical protein
LKASDSSRSASSYFSVFIKLSYRITLKLFFGSSYGLIIFSEAVFFVKLPGNKILIEMSSLLRQKKARVIISEKCADDYFLLFLFFKLTIESKSIELFCTQLNSCMYKIKIKNVVHIIFVTYQFFHEFIHKLFCLHFTNYTKIQS